MTTDPLNEDLGSVDTSFQLFAAGLYDMKVRQSDIVPNEKCQNLWKLQLTNTAPAVDTKGQPITVEGCIAFDQRALGLSGKMTQKQLINGVAEIVQAAGLTGVTLPTISQWHKQMEGKIVRVRVAVDMGGYDPKSGKTFRPSNKIEEWIKK